jgi:fructose-1,6-bisphosphatase I
VDAALLEGGTDDEGVAGGGEGPGEEAFGLAGGDAEEVLERGAAGDGEGGELVLLQEFAGALDAVLALGGGDGDGFVGAVLEGEDGSGELRGRVLRGWVLRGRRGLGVRTGGFEGEGGRGGGGGEQKASAREHGGIVGYEELFAGDGIAGGMVGAMSNKVAKMTVEQYVGAATDYEIGTIFGALAQSARTIAHKIRHAGLSDVYGAYGAVNVQGEQQRKLDVFANEELTKRLGELSSVAAIVSEEDEAPVAFDRDGAKYISIFDPLDGSSNIDVNVNVGTIFSVVALDGTVEESVLKAGTEQVAAGYVVYGPSTVMVVAMGNQAAGARKGVSVFTLDEEGAFVLSSEGMMMPEQGTYYSANEANVASWPAVYREYLGSLLEGKLGGKAYSARYIGSLVADFHRTLLKGGVFLYPPTEKTPKGKLRLLYEASPLAMIAEQAGGAAVNGEERILDLVAEGIHERTPLIIGSRREVEALQKAVLAAGEAKA